MQPHGEVLRKAERGLNEAVYALTWAGVLWGRTGAIRVSRLRAEYLKVLGEEASALSALSSTYYTAAGNAAARVGQTSGAAKYLWLCRVVWCLVRAVVLSNRLERRAGLSGMTPDQLDVRASILRKARRYQAALRCIEEALRRGGRSPDTTALLEASRGEAFYALGMSAAATIAYAHALLLCDRVRPTTSVRVLKSWGAHRIRLGERGEARRVLRDALVLAEKHHLGDQEEKIRALLVQVSSSGG